MRGASRFGDPYVVARLAAFAFVVGGFIALLLGWRGAAGTLAIPVQLSFVVSGGIGGLALVAFGFALLNAQSVRDQEAAERRKLDELLVRAERVLVAAERHRGRGPEGRP